jgi:hypothetical protein
MTTEGDGNYHLQKFLESEGAENDIQLTTAWLLYNIWEVARDTRERRDLRGPTAASTASTGSRTSASPSASPRCASPSGAARGLPGLRAARSASTATTCPTWTSSPRWPTSYYSNDLRGGEGHMEVGKLILNVVMDRRPT